MATIKPACADARNAFGKPDAGNPHVRFEEGGGADKNSPSSTRPPLREAFLPDLRYMRFLTKARLMAFTEQSPRLARLTDRRGTGTLCPSL